MVTVYIGDHGPNRTQGPPVDARRPVNADDAQGRPPALGCLVSQGHRHPERTRDTEAKGSEAACIEHRNQLDLPSYQNQAQNRNEVPF